MKFFFYLPLSLLLGHRAPAQTTITYKGQNYWGGAYVAPQWTKTYKDYSSKPPASYSSGYSSSSFKPSYSSSGSSGYSSGGNKYVNLSRYNSSGSRSNVEDQIRDERIRAEKASKQAKLFFDKLDEGIDYIVNKHDFFHGHWALTYEMAEIYQGSENNISDWDASKEYLELIKDYQDKLHYYVFLAEVKLEKYDHTVFYYNLNFTKSQDQLLKLPVAEINQIQPLTAENYYFMNEPGAVLPKAFFEAGKLKFTPEERMKADLYLVHLLTGKGKLPEARIAFNHILKFYAPLVKDMAYIADELAIIHFALGETDLAQMSIEYYCEYSKSNGNRFRLMSEIANDDGWDGRNNSEAIRFLERNFSFLEQLQRDSTGKAAIYENEWYNLYLKKSDAPASYIAKVKEYIQANPSDTFYRTINKDFYLTALLRANDIQEVNRVLGIIKAFGEQQKQSCATAYQAKLEKLVAEHRGEKKPDKSASYYMMDIYTNNWIRYYKYQAWPVSDALMTFTYLDNFRAAGGDKYIKPFVGEYVKFLKDFTKDEVEDWRYFEKFYGISFRQSRKYPSVFDPE